MMDEETRRMFMQMYARMLVNDGIIIKSLSHVVQTKDAADALYEYGDYEINFGVAISESFGGDAE